MISSLSLKKKIFTYTICMWFIYDMYNILIDIVNEIN